MSTTIQLMATTLMWDLQQEALAVHHRRSVSGLDCALLRSIAFSTLPAFLQGIIFYETEKVIVGIGFESPLFGTPVVTPEVRARNGALRGCDGLPPYWVVEVAPSHP